MTKKITASNLRAQAQQLIDLGRMPSLDELLRAVSEAQRKYVPRILGERVESKHDGPKRI